ncbi:hypothetical protein BgAZ_106830 [Babesia gibsoni]|uniref:Uncharacterized protein n=1 Tax=Babesia gibsoni TaxID=33632 RepID=A0AAD8UUH5_BABGI|nr:hypothetical protein BgAZ_106830 [Babesia gibsoni]
MGSTCVPRQRQEVGLSPKSRQSPGIQRIGGVATRKTGTSLELRAFHTAYSSFLDESSSFLYQTFSQGSHASPSECLVAAAAYVLPLMDSVENFGEMAKLYAPESVQDVINGIHQLSQFYSSVPFLSYTTSTLIYSGLVKKDSSYIPYFLRFHFLQALILSSFQNSLAMFYFKLLPVDVAAQDFISVVSMMSAVITSFGSVIYSVSHALIGRFGSLPVISDAVQLHIGKIPSDPVVTKRAPRAIEEDEMSSEDDL